MRVAVLSQWYGRDSLNIIGSIAQSIRRRGAETAVVTGEGFGAQWRPEGPWWRSRYERIDGIPVVRYPFYRSQEGSGAKRFLCYGSFSAASTLMGRRQLARADVVLVYGTPATAAAAAMAARAIDGTPFVLLVQDVWPDSIYATGFLAGDSARQVTDATVGRFVERSYRMASAVVGISPGMRDLLVSRGVDPSKAHYVYNWAPDEDRVRPLSVPVRRPGEPLHLMYSGGMGFAQDLGNVLDAVARLPQESVRLTLLGSGGAEEDLRVRANELGLTNVTFVARVPSVEVPALQSTAHMHLISLADQELFRITLPSKLQSLAAYGAPTICVAPGEVASLVEGSGMGIAVTPGDPHALAASIERCQSLTSDELVAMGRAARRLYKSEMSEEVNGERLTQILRQAAGRA